MFRSAKRRTLGVFGIVTAAAAVSATLALGAGRTHAASGGLHLGSKPGSGAVAHAVGPLSHAKLLPDGRVRPPLNAPARVKQVIRAANRLRHSSYAAGGGHGGWTFDSSGYDCSGTVSWALHGGRFLMGSPVTSGALEQWGKAGSGRWISVYANAGHTYAKIAGLYLDTGGGPGPRWHQSSQVPGDYVVRHPRGF